MQSYTCFVCDVEFQPKNRPSNPSKPFCSSSCAARHNNPLRRTNTCMWCTRKIPKSNKYCSNSCQAHHRSEQKLEQWLQSGELPPHPGAWLKRYLLSLQSGRCGICWMINEWRKEPLVFVLDHIDGNPENNHRDNLRLVCPNCDSQLPTFKARNRGSGRHWRRVRYASGKSS